MNNMPQTYYDVIKVLRPTSMTILAEDVANLFLKKQELPIYYISEYDSSFREYSGYAMEEYMANVAKNIGVTPDFLKKQNSPLITSIFEKEFNDLKHEYACFLNFLLAGKKTFFITNQLSQLLIHTEINVPSSEIHLPFFSCQFLFTDKEVIDTYYAMDMKENPNLEIDYSAPISVFATLYEKTKYKNGREMLLYSWHGKLPHGKISLQIRRLFLGNDWNLEQSLQTEWSNFIENRNLTGYVQNPLSKRQITDSSDFYTDGLSFYRLVLNTILYINSKDADIEVGKNEYKKLNKQLQNEKSFLKKEKINQELSKTSRLDYQVVGSKICPIIIQKGNVESDSNEKIEEYFKLDRKILHKFMVRGHWRNQRYGTGLTETKLIWIKPYIKGNDLAEIINKPYFVKK